MDSYIRGFALVIAFLFGGCDSRSHTRAELEGNVGKTMVAVTTLRAGIVSHWRDHKEEHQEDHVIFKIVLDECIRESSGKLSYLNIDEHKTVCDLWGHPLMFKLIGKDLRTGDIRIKVWSIGKNGLNENGSGDDIVAQN